MHLHYSHGDILFPMEGFGNSTQQELSPFAVLACPTSIDLLYLSVYFDGCNNVQDICEALETCVESIACSIAENSRAPMFQWHISYSRNMNSVQLVT